MLAWERMKCAVVGFVVEGLVVVGRIDFVVFVLCLVVEPLFEVVLVLCHVRVYLVVY